MFKIILVLLIVGHLLGDFYLQSDDLANSKNKSFARLVEHGLIYLLAMAVAIFPVFGTQSLKWILIVSVIHFMIDSLQFYLKNNRQTRDMKANRFYLVDQSIHLLSLVLVALWIVSNQKIEAYSEIASRFSEIDFINLELFFYWILAIALILKPASITINKMLDQYQPTTVKEEEKGHPGAGALIGMLERLVILILLTQHQYGAIGFVLTAKSIARYNKITENPQFSEYYLLGTLLSILLVIMTHFLIF